MFRNLILGFLVLSFCPNAVAARTVVPACNHQGQLRFVLRGITDSHEPKMVQLMKSPALRRWRNSANPIWNDTYQSIIHYPFGPKQEHFPFSFGNAFTEIRGSITLHKDKLIVDLKALEASAIDEKTKSRKTLKLESPHPGLDSSLIHAFGVLTESAQTLAEKYPSIKSLELRSSETVSPSVEASLKKLGFKSAHPKALHHLESFLHWGRPWKMNFEAIQADSLKIYAEKHGYTPLTHHGLVGSIQLPPTSDPPIRAMGTFNLQGAYPIHFEGKITSRYFTGFDIQTDRGDVFSIDSMKGRIGDLYLRK